MPETLDNSFLYFALLKQDFIIPKYVIGRDLTVIYVRQILLFSYIRIYNSQVRICIVLINKPITIS